MVGVAGFEPTMAGPKPAALPLGYTPVSSCFVRRASCFVIHEIFLKNNPQADDVIS